MNRPQFIIVLLTVSTIFLLYRASHPQFKDMAQSVGLGQIQGGGGNAWVDYNSDGSLDLLVNSSTGVKLYRANPDHTFTDVTAQAGLAGVSATGAAWGDYDNDGCPDLYLSNFGPFSSSKTPGAQDQLYHNNCNGTFTDVTEAAGIKDTSHSTGVAWTDFDHDGNLDLYVANYGLWFSDSDFRFEPNILYHNNGNGTFTNVTEHAGVIGVAKCQKVTIPPNPSPNQSLGGWKESFQPIWFDYDNDGWPDLFVATDYGVSPLYHNNRNGTFTDVTDSSGMCLFGTGMGVASGDYDNDGYLDLYVTNVGGGYLWHNNGNGTFSEVSEKVGVANKEWLSVGWGTGFFDYDNDGKLDLYVVGGTVKRQPLRDQVSTYFDRLYKNNGHGTFTDIAKQVGISGNYPKSSAILGDYNGDGFADVFVTSDYARATDVPGFNHLYRNTPNGNHWLTVQLVGVKSNRDGIGARLTLRSGGQTQIREVQAGSSFASENSLWQTFGLGKSTKIDSLEIRWPSGTKQTLTNVKVDQKLVVTEPTN